RVQQSLVSVTAVETSTDLRYAKVFISVLDKERTKETLKGLKSAGGWLRRELGARLRLRCTPELVFAEDTSIGYGAHIADLLASLNIPKEESQDDDPGNG
ncbi:MAG: 30S ribosome-binding factor RbfA, partial [Oscillospiraceae bacterium]|nr:30S ribosome-binding factor RbfA [Oscillospiraceae bacterium]